MRTHPARNLVDHFKDLSDPRVNRTKDHDLIDVLIIAVCCLLCGGESFNDMEDFGKAKRKWFKTFLSLRNGIPSHDTFNRVFAALDPEAFLECFLAWTQSLRQAIPQEIVALDGKALRRALGKGQSPKYVVSAWADGNRLVLGQLKVEEQSNEITAVPELLRVLELAGCIVTIDAMGCQKKIARAIKEADAEYVLALKGNQERVHEEVKTFLDATLLEKKQARPPRGGPAQSGGGFAGISNGGKRPRPTGDPHLLPERSTGLVCRQRQVGRALLGGPGRSHSRDPWQNQRGTTLLSVQFKAGCADLCARSAGPLGSGEPGALGD